MTQNFRRALLGFVIALAATLALSAQVTIPYPTFQPNTDILSSEVNANNAALSTNALNRTGGTMTGVLTSSGGSFSGNWGGSPTFSGTPVLSGGGTLGGTWAGNPTFSGTPVFSNMPTFSSGIVPAARLGTGTADATTYLRGDNSFVTIPIPISSYAPTLASVTNSLTNTTVLSFSVPAMGDGDVIDVWMAVKRSNNSGGSVNVTYTFAYGGTSNTGATSWNTTASSPFNDIIKFTMQRVGADLWVLKPIADGGADSAPWGSISNRGGQNIVVSAPTFTSAQTVSLKVQFDTAGATVFFQPQTARVMHFKS